MTLLLNHSDARFTRRRGDRLVKAVIMFRAGLDPERCRPAAASVDSAENSAGLSFSQFCTSCLCIPRQHQAEWAQMALSIDLPHKSINLILNRAVHISSANLFCQSLLDLVSEAFTFSETV